MATAPRRRLDEELVRRGLCETTGEARAAIARGEVLVGGAPAVNSNRLVAAGEAVQVTGPAPRYVGRGGEKLHAALERFDLDLNGKRVLDAGASTGGFTDCALQAGAASVVAVDVGRGQIHDRLRRDHRVEVHERTNIRTVDPARLAPAAEIVVADLSFISLRVVARALMDLAAPGAELIWLVKPQFEADRAEASENRGVIEAPEIWERVLREVCATMDGLGAAIMGVMASPLRGAEGNVEFLVHGRIPVADRVGGADPEALIDAAVAEAQDLVGRR